MNIENQLSDCVTNGQGVAVRRCCASCAMREIKKDGSRICSLMHITVKSRFKCRQWKMSDGLMNAGITKDSRRKEEKRMEATLMLYDKLMEFEGLRLQAYRDAAGVLTIGYGHTGGDVSEGDKISEYWARQLLHDDVGAVEAAVRRMRVARTEGQFDALVSFAFNLGVERLQNSTLLKLIRGGASKAAIKKEFKRWVYAGGRKLKGLETRRDWEAKRFFE